MTTIVPIEEHPGYSWHWVAPLGQWVLKWRPLPDRYSPPVFNTRLRWYHIRPPPIMKSPNVLRLHHHRRAFRVAYIVYRPDIQRIEVWARDLEHAVISVHEYLRSVIELLAPARDGNASDNKQKPIRLMPPLPQTKS